MPAYYNEIEPFAAAWLRALIKRKMIPEGEVDERSIVDVSPDDLVGFHQCHFFAGIGGWPYALRLAGWDDDREVWSGSAPCQSLSIAGKGEMHTDDWRKLRAGAENPVVDPRHLWPAFYKLIAARKPAAVFGEQVGKRAGLDWLTAVRADLEDFGYAVGGADLPACSVGAPHIRQRIFWVGVACGLGDSTGRRDERQRTDWAFSKHVNAGQAIGLADADRADLRVPRRGSDDGAPAGEQGAERKRERLRDDAGAGGGGAIGLADAERERREGIGLLLRAERGAVPEAAGSGGERAAFTASDGRAGSAHGLGHTSDQGLQTRERTTALGEGRRVEGRTAPEPGEASDRVQRGAAPGRPGADHGGWEAVDWLRCRDAKWRPTKPGLLPLVDRLPKRMGRVRAGSIRGYGNAIVPQVAAVFVGAVMDWVDGAGDG